MSTRLLLIAAMIGLAAPLGAHAQSPRPAARAPGMGPGGNAAQFLLSRTAQLELTDAQVVRLAEIARETDARRRELRATLEATRPPRPQPGADNAEARAARQAAAEQRRAEIQREREEALAVLTAEQQAQARELLARPDDRPRPMRPGVGGADRAPGPMRGAMMRDGYRMPPPGRSGAPVAR